MWMKDHALTNARDPYESCKRENPYEVVGFTKLV
jgi:hypothetical protein